MENVPVGKKEEKQNNKSNPQNLPSQYVHESAINSKRTRGHVYGLSPKELLLWKKTQIEAQHDYIYSL